MTKLHDSNSRDSVKSDEINESALPVIETIEETIQEKNSKTCTESTDLDEPLTGEEAGKKIKWDCGQHYSDLSDHAAANSSRVRDSEEPVQTASNSNIDVPPVAPVSSTPIRNKCIYGSKCYRSAILIGPYKLYIFIMRFFDMLFLLFTSYGIGMC